MCHLRVLLAHERFVCNRELGDEDCAFLSLASQGGVQAFVANVLNDLSFTAFTMSDEGQVIVAESDFVACLSKGGFASLQNGFWLVRNRLRQVDLEAGVQRCVEQLDNACRKTYPMESTAASALINRDQLPPIAVVDYISKAIEILDKHSVKAMEPFSSTDLVSLRSCTKSEPVVSACLKVVPGWLLNESKVSGEVWAGCAESLRAVRSYQLLNNVRSEIELQLPKMMSVESCRDFLDFIFDQCKASADLDAFMAGLSWEELKPEDMPGMLTFAARLLARLSGVTWLSLSKTFYIYIYIYI